MSQKNNIPIEAYQRAWAARQEEDLVPLSTNQAQSEANELRHLSEIAEALEPILEKHKDISHFPVEIFSEACFKSILEIMG